MMIRESLAHALPEPDFVQQAGELVTTVWRDWLTEKVVNALGLNERQTQAIAHTSLLPEEFNAQEWVCTTVVVVGQGTRDVRLMKLGPNTFDGMAPSPGCTQPRRPVLRSRPAGSRPSPEIPRHLSLKSARVDLARRSACHSTWASGTVISSMFPLSHGRPYWPRAIRVSRRTRPHRVGHRLETATPFLRLPETDPTFSEFFSKRVVDGEGWQWTSSG